MAVRDRSKAQAAMEQIVAEIPYASLDILPLDLADLASIHTFGERFRSIYTSLDLLINNAGVMGIPYSQTADGFEMQFGVNHLGHFALTGLLLPRILEAQDARVVTVSSAYHHRAKAGSIAENGKRGYDKWDAYSRSKLSNLLFAYELQRRFEACGVDAISVAAHPGYASTNLQLVGPRMEASSWKTAIMKLGNRLVAQSAASGALPTLHAATAPNVDGGEYFGPGGLFEMRGYPKKVNSSPSSRDPEAAARLWELSETLTGVTFSLC
jgi:NAD(P)-dependent dehydrogenase (short-subunit alcohol dehydrogenase family)